MITLNYRDTKPIYEQIRDEFRRLIAAGILGPGEKLPSVRELSVSLSINPNTIQRAYRELEASGCIYTIAGKGSFAAETDDVRKKQTDELLASLKKNLIELHALEAEREEILAIVRAVYSDSESGSENSAVFDESCRHLLPDAGPRPADHK